MSNLAIKRHEREMVPTVESASPFHAMRRLLGWDPFREMAPFMPVEEAGLSFMPAFEIKETKDSYEFRADMPGVKDKDIEITVTGHRLMVSGTREAEGEDRTDRYFAKERLYGSFVRSFTLPEDVDPQHVRATLTDGVLSITLNKKPETQPKRIELESHAAEPQHLAPKGADEPKRAALATPEASVQAKQGQPRK